MSAKQKAGMATLEEFLQEKYVENFEENDKYNSKLDLLISKAETKKYFQRASNSEYYFLDTNSYKEYYFIEKSALPNEIKNAITSGDNSLTNKTIYAEFNDIYGITEDLKIYYCSNGYSSWIGAEDTAKVTDLDEIVFEKDDPWAKALGQENDVTVNDLRVGSLTISDGSLDLTKLEKFGTLSTLNIRGTFNNLNGIELAPNLKNIYIYENAVINDYSSLGKVKLLNQLYFVDSNDNEIRKFCEGCSNDSFDNLEYLSISSGDNRYYFNVYSDYERTTRNSKITTIEPLNMLSSNFKKTLKYLCLACNEITSLEPIADYSNINFINVRNCRITNLKGVNSKELTTLCMNNNLLGKNIDNISGIEVAKDALSFITESKLSGGSYTFTPKLKKLSYLELTNNPDIIWLDYLGCYSTLSTIYMNGCTGIDYGSMSKLKSFIASRTYKIDVKYNLLFLKDDSTVINIKNQTIDYDAFLELKKYRKAVDMNLEGVRFSDSSTDVNIAFNNLLNEMPQLKYLCIKNQPQLTNFSFLKNLDKLIYFDCRDTGAETSDTTATTNLQLLNNITTLIGLAVNSSKVDLTKLQTTINRLGCDRFGGDRARG